MTRHIIHIHISAFAIALERANRPELRGRPVVVAPHGSERAVILSESTEARREGIFKGMALSSAVKFCPELIVLPPNPCLIEKGTRLLAGMASRYTPIWEPSRPGHLYMDITGTERLWGRAKDTACRIRNEIKVRLSLYGTIGVAGNKMVSSIASRVKPSEGIFDVDHGREPAFIAPLRVDLLPGVGHVRRRMLLEELNISLIREVAVLDVNSLKLIFGRYAWVIHERSMGIDPTPVNPPLLKPEVSESITLPSDENDDRKLLGVIYSLVEKCSQRLRRNGMIPGRASLILRYSDQMEVSRQVGLSRGSLTDSDLYAVMEQLFFKIYQRRTCIRFIRVRFSDLSLPSPQLSLFPPYSDDKEKEDRITLALDCIRERYGDELIKYGRTCGLRSAV